MQPSVIVRRFMLVSGLGELVPIILNTSLACGLTVRPRANTIVDTVTYLVDETSSSTVDGGLGRRSEPPWAGATSSRGNHGPVIRSRYPYPTYSGVGPAAGGLQGTHRLSYDPSIVRLYQRG